MPVPNGPVFRAFAIICPPRHPVAALPSASEPSIGFKCRRAGQNAMTLAGLFTVPWLVARRGEQAGATPALDPIDDKEKLGLTFTYENEAWDAELIVVHLVGEFERHVSPDTAGWTRAVEVALDRLARNSEIKALDEERILKFIVSASKGAFSLTTLRGELKKLRMGEITGTDHTEVTEAATKDLEEFESSCSAAYTVPPQNWRPTSTHSSKPTTKTPPHTSGSNPPTRSSHRSSVSARRQ